MYFFGRGRNIPMSSETKLGALVNEVRKREKLSLRSLSEKVGISHVYLSRIELGSQIPTTSKLIQLSLALPFTEEEKEKYLQYLQEMKGIEINYAEELRKLNNEITAISNGEVNDFGLLIRQKRKQQGMTVQHLGKQLNVSDGYIYHLELNNMLPPLQRTLLLTHVLSFTEEETEMALAYIRKNSETNEGIENIFGHALLASDLSDLSEEDIEDIKRYIRQTKEKRKKIKKQLIAPDSLSI